ncbi:unnamed protein product [Lathyrus sativus]|nr:unnamed protein product [Lathyrus sativus]
METLLTTHLNAANDTNHLLRSETERAMVKMDQHKRRATRSNLILFLISILFDLTTFCFAQFKLARFRLLNGGIDV